MLLACLVMTSTYMTITPACLVMMSTYMTMTSAYLVDDIDLCRS